MVSLSLTQPAIGSTAWGTDVNNDLSKIQDSINSVALLLHTAASGTDGGTSTGAAWSTRPLDTKLSDPNGIVTLASNQFTLGAGSYLIEAGQVFFGQSGTQVGFRGRIRNVTDSVDAALSLSVRLHIPAGSSASEECKIPPTLLVLTSSKTFELQYYAQSGIAGTGLGFALAGAGVTEYYAYVFIRKFA